MFAYSQAPGTAKGGMKCSRPRAFEPCPQKQKRGSTCSQALSPFFPAAAEGVPFRPQAPDHWLHRERRLVLGGEEVLRRDSRWTSRGWRKEKVCSRLMADAAVDMNHDQIAESCSLAVPSHPLAWTFNLP